MNFRSVFIVALIVLVSGCTKPIDNSKIFRYNESKGIPTLDPAHARNQTIIWPASNIFNGLVQLDSSLRIKPCIAKRWNYDSGGRRFTFWLRNDVYFHRHSAFGPDRTRMVTAHDFVYSFNRILDPQTGSSGAWVFNYVDKNFGQNGFKALNDSVLQIVLKEPFEPFLGILSMVYCSVVPKEVVEENGKQFGYNPIGTGPFYLARWELNNCLILKKNPDYFEVDSLGVRLPYLEGVYISFIADKQSEFMEFLLGKIDFLSGIHATYKDELLTRDGKLRQKYQQRFVLKTTPYLNTEYLGFTMDTTHAGYLPLSIRQAVNYCFDRKQMVAFLRNNLAVPAYRSIISPSLRKNSANDSPGYYPNKAQAIELVQSVQNQGYKIPINITLLTTPDYLDIAEFIQHEARQVGINLNIETATGAAFRQKVANGEPAFFRASWIADYPHAENFLLLFASKNKTPLGPNYTKYENNIFDLLYNKIASGESTESDLSKAEQIIFESSPVVPLFYDVVVRFVNSSVQNFPLNSMNNLELKYVRKSIVAP